MKNKFRCSKGVKVGKNRLGLHLAAVLAIAFFTFLAISSATPPHLYVPIKYIAPGRLNMSGINKIAIDSDDARIISELSRRLTASGKFTVASPAELSAWKQWKASEAEARRRWEAQRAVEMQLLAFQRSAIEIEATALSKAYTDNSARADLSYDFGQNQGKPLKISGVIKEIGNSSKGTYYARLDGGKDSVDVFFAPNQQRIIASFNKGSRITVFGKCHGYKRPSTDDSAEILRALGAGNSVYIDDVTFPVELGADFNPGNYSVPADAVVTITKNVKLQDTNETRKENRPVGKDANGYTIYQEVNVTYYYREAKLDLHYEIVRTRDGSLVGKGVKSATSSRYSGEKWSDLPSSDKIASDIIGQPLVELAGEMIPTEQITYAFLIWSKEESDSKAKKEMKQVEKQLTKTYDYKTAVTAYGVVYAKYNNFTAGYNQAVLTEGTEGTAAAIVLMEALVNKHSHGKAKATLAEMQLRNAKNQQAAQQLAPVGNAGEGN